jgi:hypothetical protein
MHGYNDYHSLAFDAKAVHTPASEDATKWLRRRALDLDLERSSIVIACRTGDSVFAAIDDSDGIGAIYIPHDGERNKVYSEGDAFADNCPASVLSHLTPTRNLNKLLWREGAWIRALRADLIEDESFDGFAPWMLLSAMRESAGFQPVLAARAATTTRLYGMCNWEVTTLLTVNQNWEIGCDYLYPEGERPLDQADQMLRCPATRTARWLQLGVAPFRTWVMLSKGGGYVTWTADPWHFSATVPDIGMLSDGQPQQYEMTVDQVAAAPLLEMAARGRCAAGTDTYAKLREAVLAGEFDTKGQR